MFKRPILMNEQDGSPGNGAPPTPPAPSAPATPAANTGGAAIAPTPSLDDIKGVIGSMMGDLRNGIFADLRKSGVLKSEKSAPAQPEATQNSAQPNANQDVAAMFARQRAFDRAVGAAGLNDEQASLLEGMFQSMRPEDPGQWATSVIKTMGLGQKNATSSTAIPTQPANNQSAPAAQAAQTQQPPAPTTNISDRGPASSSDARDPVALMKHRITDVTRDDWDRLVADLGPQKASDQYVASAQAYLRSVKLVPDRRSR